MNHPRQSCCCTCRGATEALCASVTATPKRGGAELSAATTTPPPPLPPLPPVAAAIHEQRRHQRGYCWAVRSAVRMRPRGRRRLASGGRCCSCIQQKPRGSVEVSLASIVQSVGTAGLSVSLGSKFCNNDKSRARRASHPGSQPTMYRNAATPHMCKDTSISKIALSTGRPAAAPH